MVAKNRKSMMSLVRLPILGLTMLMCEILWWFESFKNFRICMEKTAGQQSLTSSTLLLSEIILKVLLDQWTKGHSFDSCLESVEIFSNQVAIYSW